MNFISEEFSIWSRGDDLEGSPLSPILAVELVTPLAAAQTPHERLQEGIFSQHFHQPDGPRRQIPASSMLEFENNGEPSEKYEPPTLPHCRGPRRLRGRADSSSSVLSWTPESSFVRPLRLGPPPPKKGRKPLCVFCRNNGEPESFYLTHTVRDDLGKTTCPLLRKYACPHCGATGDEAHTVKYCKKKPPTTGPTTDRTNDCGHAYYF